MQYLIFEHGYRGHRLEYLHHQYMYAGNYELQNKFIFILHPGMKQRMELINFPIFPNTEIEYIPEYTAKDIDAAFIVKKSWKLSKLLKQYIDRLNPDIVIVDELMAFMPSLPLIIRKQNLLRGIIYRIPRRRNNGILKKIIYNTIFKLFAKSNIFERIWILNDSTSCSHYNLMYKTKKFKFLPDPINIDNFSNKKVKSIKDQFNGRIIFLHAGGLGERKGTFCIVDAIKLMKPEERQKCAFIFAGSIVNSDERNKMLQFIQNNNQDNSIYYSDEFIRFDLFLNYFTIADYVLIPYSNSEQSSGILGYSAYFKKKVIGPNNGLLGEIINKYNLGYTIQSINPKNLKEIIVSIITDKPQEANNHLSDVYASICTVDKFTHTIFAN